MNQEATKNDEIYVVAQQFYGNKTGTTIPREKVDHFLRGDLDDICPEPIDDVARKVVQVPGTDNVVVIYDQTQEDEYVNVHFPALYAEKGTEYLERWGEELRMEVSCSIPEMGIELHTRCFACRIDSDGVLQSLKPGDGEKLIKYFA